METRRQGTIRDAREESGISLNEFQGNNTGGGMPVTQWFSADSPWWTQEAADVYPTFDFEAGTVLLQEYIGDPARSDGKAAGEAIDVALSCPPDPTLIAARCSSRCGPAQSR